MFTGCYDVYWDWSFLYLLYILLFEEKYVPKNCFIDFCLSFFLEAYKVLQVGIW